MCILISTINLGTALSRTLPSRRFTNPTLPILATNRVLPSKKVLELLESLDKAGRKAGGKQYRVRFLLAYPDLLSTNVLTLEHLARLENVQITLCVLNPMYLYNMIES